MPVFLFVFVFETGHWTRETLHLDPVWQDGFKTVKLEFKWESWLSTLESRYLFHLSMAMQRWAGIYGRKFWELCFSETTVSLAQNDYKRQRNLVQFFKGEQWLLQKGQFDLWPWFWPRVAPSHRSDSSFHPHCSGILYSIMWALTVWYLELGVTNKDTA